VDFRYLKKKNTSIFSSFKLAIQKERRKRKQKAREKMKAKSEKRSRNIHYNLQGSQKKYS